jgi:hypothetical protein
MNSPRIRARIVERETLLPACAARLIRSRSVQKQVPVEELLAGFKRGQVNAA